MNQISFWQPLTKPKALAFTPKEAYSDVLPQSDSKDTVHFAGKAAKISAATLALSDIGIDVALIALQWNNLSQGHIEVDTLVHIAGVLNGILAATAALLLSQSNHKANNELVFQDIQEHRSRFVLARSPFRSPKDVKIIAKDADELMKAFKELTKQLGYRCEISESKGITLERSEEPQGEFIGMSARKRRKLAQSAIEVYQRSLELGEAVYSKGHPLNLALQIR